MADVRHSPPAYYFGMEKEKLELCADDLIGKSGIATATGWSVMLEAESDY